MQRRALRKSLISLDCHPGQFLSSSFSPINETIKRALMRIRTSCSSGASPTCQSRSFYVGRDCLTQTFYNMEGGKKNSAQSTICSKTEALHIPPRGTEELQAPRPVLLHVYFLPSPKKHKSKRDKASM